jgi:mono/diheme cytochrome c family protein
LTPSAGIAAHALGLLTARVEIRSLTVAAQLGASPAEPGTLVSGGFGLAAEWLASCAVVRVKSLLITILSSSVCLCAAGAQHGAVVLEQQGCLECHTVGGQGIGHEANATAPDLALRIAPTYSPSVLASVLWNHTPAMWAEMAARGIAPPAASEADWQDLFAYLYSLQFREPVGQARRGKDVFESKHCVDCHSVANAPPPHRGPIVPAWGPVNDPVVFVFKLWNHGSGMRDQIEKNKKDWKTLTGRDLADLTAYVQSVQRIPPKTTFSMPDPASGKELFRTNCRICHDGPIALDTVLWNKTWMDIGAAMWNHTPTMRPIPVVSSDDMRKILAYVWELQYTGPPGNPRLGEKQFAEKRCAECHNGSPRPGENFTAFSMITLGWGPARQMHQQMTQQGIAWPNLSPAHVSNIAAYLDSLSSTPPGR